MITECHSSQPDIFAIHSFNHCDEEKLIYGYFLPLKKKVSRLSAHQVSYFNSYPEKIIEPWLWCFALSSIFTFWFSFIPNSFIHFIYSGINSLQNSSNGNIFIDEESPKPIFHWKDSEFLWKFVHFDEMCP